MSADGDGIYLEWVWLPFAPLHGGGDDVRTEAEADGYVGACSTCVAR